MSRFHITVEQTRAAPGIVTSRKALGVLDFIESCGGVPEDALAVVFRKSRQLLAKLRGAGMIYRVMGGGKVMWLPVDVPPPIDAEVYMRKFALGWLAARLKESGGRYENGTAVFPSGAVFHVATVPPAPSGPCLAVFLRAEKVQLCKGSIWVKWDELQESSLRECLKSDI